MRVRATAEGLYGKRRHEGDEFSIDKPEDLGSWMEPIEGEDKPDPKPKVADLRKMAEDRGIDHEGLSKPDLAAAIEAHDNPQGTV